MDDDILQRPISFLKGVGPAKAKALNEELNIHTFIDLLFYFPFRYIDRTVFHRVVDLREDMGFAQVVLEIEQMHVLGRGRTQRLSCIASDPTGKMELVWFQGVNWVADILQMHKKYVLFGRVSVFNNRFQMSHPEISEYQPDAQKKQKIPLVPVYNSTEKLKKYNLDSKGIVRLQSALIPQVLDFLRELLPAYIRERYRLAGIKLALKEIHFPSSPEGLHEAQRRLKFSELFFIQLRLLYGKIFRKARIQGHILENTEFFLEFVENHLPFELTTAQKKVLLEIKEDLISEKQMNRLVQGDVGSGKTIVAILAMLIAKDNLFQSCFMAPTEILARQQFANTQKLLKDSDISIDILTGSSKKKERTLILEKLQNGEIDILFGTHALIEKDVIFKNLGLAVIDEQHRFGVEQRAKLYHKNTPPPHILVMTATPIPRTLAMTLYGDLDISVIDELPKGRKAIATKIVNDSKRLSMYGFLQSEIRKGRQIYIVFPLIEESEMLDLKNLNEGFEEIKRYFPAPEFSVQMLHGKMTPKEKENSMNEFKEGKVNILVSTTVVEVGVDVPNATVMVIENAERFGLAQLHQLRGRVGRGAEQSYCFLLIGSMASPDVRTRLKTMEDTNDGFEIAEMDLKLRGPGELEGTRQSGMLQLKVADLVKDQIILREARRTVEEILDKDPMLIKEENKILKRFVESTLSGDSWANIS